MKKTDELISMIFKTHTEEWLTAKSVTIIANAIKGADIPKNRIKRGIKKLLNQRKLIQNKNHFSSYG